MGQKINPTIFRLGVNKTWKTEFFEKKNNELPLYVFKDLEVRNYIERVLETYGIILHDYKQHYNGSTLNLYISYFVTSDFALNKKENIEKLMVQNSSGEKKVVKSSYNHAENLIHLSSGKKITDFLDNSSRLYKLKQYMSSTPSLKSSSQQDFVAPQKKVLREFNNRSFKVDGIFDQVFEVLNLFSNNRLNITLNLCCTNKDLYFLKLSQEKIFMSLHKIFYN